jgi:hypothetical protein
MSPFPAQTRVKVRITREKRSFESQATVVYSVAGMGMGLQFAPTDPQQLLSLRKWLDEVRGEAITETHAGEEKNSPDGAVGCESVLNELAASSCGKASWLNA